MSSIENNCLQRSLTVTDLSEKRTVVRADPRQSLHFAARAGGAAGPVALGRGRPHRQPDPRTRACSGAPMCCPTSAPSLCIGAANLDRKLRSHAPLHDGHLESGQRRTNPSAAWRAISPRTWRGWARRCSLITAVGNDSSGTRPARPRRSGRHRHARQPAGSTAPAAAPTPRCWTQRRRDGGRAGRHGPLRPLTPGFLASRQPQRAAAALVVADLNLPLRIGRHAAGRRRARRRRRWCVVAVSRTEDGAPADRPARPAPADPEPRRTGNARRPPAARPTPTVQRSLPRSCRPHGARDIIVTLRRAAACITPWARRLHGWPAHDAEVVDVTGAGDAFCGRRLLVAAAGGERPRRWPAARGLQLPA